MKKCVCVVRHTAAEALMNILFLGAVTLSLEHIFLFKMMRPVSQLLDVPRTVNVGVKQVFIFSL